VPSHGVHAWAQTYALDLVNDPGDGSRPAWAWWPLARRPDDFPGFGEPVFAPVSGEVVRARGGMRDHRSRTSPPALVYFALESVRELLGPPGILGNHVVIRRDDGACVVVAHLIRKSSRGRANGTTGSAWVW
jgi:murein DD-endopeptidase MepM/ murein hydrolase activator NlpD